MKWKKVNNISQSFRTFLIFQWFLFLFFEKSNLVRCIWILQLHFAFVHKKNTHIYNLLFRLFSQNKTCDRLICFEWKYNLLAVSLGKAVKKHFVLIEPHLGQMSDFCSRTSPFLNFVTIRLWWCFCAYDNVNGLLYNKLIVQ